MFQTYLFHRISIVKSIFCWEVSLCKSTVIGQIRDKVCDLSGSWFCLNWLVSLGSHINQHKGEQNRVQNCINPSFTHPCILINLQMDDLQFVAESRTNTFLCMQSIFPPAQPSPSVKVKCTSSHLGQKWLCKPNKDTSPWEIKSHAPFLCNLFLSCGRMSPLRDHLLLSSRKLESLQLLREICHLNLQRKYLIYLNLQLLKWLIFWWTYIASNNKQVIMYS